MKDRETLIIDPTEKEEQILDGKIVMAMNSHRELCAVHCSGGSVFRKDQLLRCSSKAVPRAKELSDLMNKIFEEDTKRRLEKMTPSFSSLVGTRLITGTSQNEHLREPLSTARTLAEETPMEITAAKVQKSPDVIRKGKAARVANTTARLPTENDDSDIEIVSEVTKSTVTVLKQENVVVESLPEGKKKRKTRTAQASKDVQLLLNEIEEDVQVLSPSESGYKSTSKPDEDDSSIQMIDLAEALIPPKTGKGKQKKSK